MPLTQGKSARISRVDLQFITQWKWCYHVKGYAVRTAKDLNGGQITVRMHRVVASQMGLDIEQYEVDHRDRDRLNNIRQNLRVATDSQNAANQSPRGGSSQFKGVVWRADREKWRAAIKVSGRFRSLGHFEIEKDAAKAYDKAALDVYGDYAYLNFPQQ